MWNTIYQPPGINIPIGQHLLHQGTAGVDTGGNGGGSRVASWRHAPRVRLGSGSRRDDMARRGD